MRTADQLVRSRLFLGNGGIIRQRADHLFETMLRPTVSEADAYEQAARAYVALALQYADGLLDLRVNMDVRDVRARIETVRQALCMIQCELFSESGRDALQTLAIHMPGLVGDMPKSAAMLRTLQSISHEGPPLLEELDERLKPPPGPSKNIALRRYISYGCIVWREATGKWPAKTADEENRYRPKARVCGLLESLAETACGERPEITRRFFLEGLASAQEAFPNSHP